MKIYFEQIPEHYEGPQVSVTIHYKPESGAGLADELAEKLKTMLQNRGEAANF